MSLVTEGVDFETTRVDEVGVSAFYVPYDGVGARPTNFAVARGGAESSKSDGD